MPGAADGPKNLTYTGGRPIAQRYHVPPRSGESMNADLKRRKKEAEEHERDVQFLEDHPNALSLFGSIREARQHHEREQKRQRKALLRSSQ